MGLSLIKSNQPFFSEECGKRTENKRTKHKKGRIIGGENRNNDGWLALLYFEGTLCFESHPIHLFSVSDASTPQYRCAETVINNKYILTVLHCVVKDPAANIDDLETFDTTTAKVEIRGVKIRNKKKINKGKK